MNAPDLKTVYNFEDNLANGFVSILDGLVDNLYTQRQNVSELTPRCEVKIVPGAATEHACRDPLGIRRFDIFNFDLHLMIVTTRSDNYASHSLALSKIRAQLSDIKNNVNGIANANFPYYEITYLRENGTQPAFQADEDFDQSGITYSGVFGILSTAWPTT